MQSHSCIWRTSSSTVCRTTGSVIEDIVEIIRESDNGRYSFKIPYISPSLAYFGTQVDLHVSQGFAEFAERSRVQAEARMRFWSLTVRRNSFKCTTSSKYTVGYT